MPAKRATPAGKQRVRTGCLTCRKRRRKCDERKPRCDNCEVKGFSCKYGADLTFLSAPHPNPQSDGALNRTVQAYSTITFVVDDDPPPASTTTESDERILYQHTPGRGVQDDSTTALDGSISQQFGFGPTAEHESDSAVTNIARIDARPYHVRRPRSPRDAPEQTIQHNASSLLIDDRGRTPPGRSLNTSYNRANPGSTFSDQLLGRQAPTSSNEETGLLRHFRYNLAPWIDVGDPESSFGIKIILLARANRPVFAAILALAACQRSLIYRQQNGDDLGSRLRLREEAEHGLAFEEGLVSRVGKVLLMLDDFFSSSPQQWRNLVLHQRDTLDSLVSLAAPEEELNEPLFWLHFRIDLAASIVGGQPPLIAFPSHLLSNRSSRSPFQSLSQWQSAKQVHQHCLILLANCLSLIFGDREVSSPLDHSNLAVRHSMRNSNFSSRWISLWTDCQKWYNDRPVEVRQILDIRGVEVDQIEMQNSSSFPILIYTTPLALVSNAVYHITSLLLLSHKPRLLKPLAGPRCFTSHIWHAHTIAGIATSNESLEKWDPILIAGLLLMAKEMTHESQQLVLLERLRGITATTGIKLDREIEILKSGWNISRYDEETVT